MKKEEEAAAKDPAFWEGRMAAMEKDKVQRARGHGYFGPGTQQTVKIGSFLKHFCPRPQLLSIKN